LAALPAVMITRASQALASMMAVVPMPLEPPCTSSVSPRCRRARSNTFIHTVKKVSGSAAASSRLSLPGTGRHCTAGTLTYCA
jgi:hypothetical protein